MAELSIAEKASYAKLLLENPFLESLLKEIKEELLILWETSEYEAKDKREFLWSYRKAVAQFEGRLIKSISEAAVDKKLEEARETAMRPRLTQEDEGKGEEYV